MTHRTDPHRSEDQDGRARREAIERLERVAGEAANPIERDLREQRHAAERTRRGIARHDEKSVRWTHRYSVLGPVVANVEMGLWIVPFLSVGAVVAGPFVGWPFWSVGGGVLAAVSLAWLTVANAHVARDLRWPTSLPFRVEGYREALGESSGASTVLRVDVRLKATTDLPEASSCQRIFGSIAASVELDGATLHVKSPALELTQLSSTFAEYGTHRVRRWIRTVVGDMLVPFHREFPVAEVVITPGG